VANWGDSSAGRSQDTPDQRIHPADPISIPPTSVIRITADDLLAQFRTDEKAADRVFRDRTVEVSGKVVCIRKTKTDKPVVVFGEGCAISAHKVEFYFESMDNQHVREGATCVIRGRCRGKGIGGPWFKECVVLSAPQ
jgi:hypothetical protein